MRVIATSRPIKHGNKLISKSLESLNRLLSLDSLPIVDEHNGKEIGTVRGFMLRVRNGMTEVLADVPSFPNRGFSLQFAAKLIDDVFHIEKFHHLAVTDNPRDALTFSESDNTETEVIETMDKQTENEATDSGKVDQPLTETPPDKPSITSDQLLAILSDSTVKDRLLDLLGVSVESDKPVEPKPPEPPEPKTEPEKTEPVIRVVVKPNTPEIKAETKPRTTLIAKQLPFPSI